MSDFGLLIKIKSAALLFVVVIIVTSAFASVRETPVVMAVRKVGPSVVNISTQRQVSQSIHPFSRNPLFDSFFRDFFEPQYQQRTNLGSGVIIDGDRGFILTNAHVIEQGTDIRVMLHDERQFDVRIVGVDAESDLAVLQIMSEESLPSIEMGDSEDIMIGETIIAIGNPFGFSHTVTTGVVSAIDRSIKAEAHVYHNFIQTDASINPGNSGGPLLNIKGELIGINTAIYAKAQGIGFAIPINTAKRIVADLIQHGHVIQAWIGLIVQDLDAQMADYLNVQDVRGVVVSQVETDSPAELAGLSAGDLIIALNRHKSPSPGEYLAAARTVAAGDTLSVFRWQNSKISEIQVHTKPFPKVRIPEMTWRRLGVRVSDITPDLRRQFSISGNRGVAITAIRQGSHLERIGARPGDLVAQLDDHTTATYEDFIAAMEKSRLKSSLLLVLLRNHHLYHLTVPLAP